MYMYVVSNRTSFPENVIANFIAVNIPIWVNRFIKLKSYKS